MAGPPQVPHRACRPLASLGTPGPHPGLPTAGQQMAGSAPVLPGHSRCLLHVALLAAAPAGDTLGPCPPTPSAQGLFLPQSCCRVPGGMGRRALPSCAPLLAGSGMTDNLRAMVRRPGPPREDPEPSAAGFPPTWQCPQGATENFSREHLKCSLCFPSASCCLKQGHVSGPDSRGSEKETAMGAGVGEDGGSGHVGRSGQRHAIVDELREPWTRAGSVAEGHGAGQGGPQSAFPSLSP